nr:immunoglobulin heavy chain junction region [Homo sapiens]
AVEQPEGLGHRHVL